MYFHNSALYSQRFTKEYPLYHNKILFMVREGPAEERRRGISEHNGLRPPISPVPRCGVQPVEEEGIPVPNFLLTVLTGFRIMCGMTAQTQKTPQLARATGFYYLNEVNDYLFKAWATSTAQATVQPTMGLLPIPRKPIISTCAGTDEEPAN